MTGFASVDAGEGGGLRLTIKAVNHRFLDLSLRLPAGCEAVEMRLRRVLKERVRRGHVELTVSVERRADGGYAVNEAVLGGYVDALRTAARRLSLEGEPDLAGLARLPGVIGADGRESALPADFEARLMTALEPLLLLFDTAREEEGAALAGALRASLDALAGLTGEARGLRAGVRDDHLARLRDRMKHLLAGATEVSESRLITEVALLAERSDIEEELLRLETHLESFATALAAGGEVGKKLDFLSQEMNREVNTILSKTGSAAGRDGLKLTEIGLACRAEVERIREQVQNIE